MGTSSRLLLLSLLMAASACGGDDSVASSSDSMSRDSIADGKESMQRIDEGVGDGSHYRFVVRIDDGESLEFERDLTFDADALVFGGTHISPAVALAIHSSHSKPVWAMFTLQIGIIRRSDSVPANVSSVGEYNLGAGRTRLEVVLDGATFDSGFQGSSGTLTISKWSDQPGGTMAGEVQAELVKKSALVPPPKMNVRGEFSLVLPEL